MAPFLAISQKRGTGWLHGCPRLLCLVLTQRPLKNEGIELFSCQAVPITAAGPLGEKPLVKYDKVGKGSRQIRSVTWGKRLALLDKGYWGVWRKAGREKEGRTRKGGRDWGGNPPDSPTHLFSFNKYPTRSHPSRWEGGGAPGDCEPVGGNTRWPRARCSTFFSSPFPPTPRLYRL